MTRGPGQPKSPPTRARPRAGAARPVSGDFSGAFPLLPIRDQVYFPRMIFPLLVGREKSMRAVNAAAGKDKRLFIAAQRNVLVEEPSRADIFEVGIVARILQLVRVPDGTIRLMLEGLERCRATRYLQDEPFFRVRVAPMLAPETSDVDIEALMRHTVAQFEQVAQAGRGIPADALINVANTNAPGRLADVITPYLRELRIEAQQEILETADARERLQKLSGLLDKEARIMEVQNNIRDRVEKEMGETQREFILREQLKAIHEELGETLDTAGEAEAYRSRIGDAGMPDQVAERARKEVARLEKSSAAAPEGVVIRTYLDWLTSVPWSTRTPDDIDLDAAARVLDEDHFGLDRAKERIVEFLAVRKLTGTTRGPILCFVGPPGVGKTSIGESIARALGRKFVRVSLGGIRDEAEIRGHRRTYIGAMPGRIIQGIRQAGVRNPVFMLDEIDKLGIDFRGDPSSALLEALDPEQNCEFSDHYLEVPFDLSDVMFVTTANLLEPVPAALRDRLEVISFSGYTEHDKVEIANRFLIPKQRRDHGLPDAALSISASALNALIREYTREAGVRSLEREIAAVCRKVARRVAGGESGRVDVGADDLRSLLGPRRYRYGVMEQGDEVAVATGLVYTEFGGDIVTVEVSLMKSHDGKVQLTGQLGDVMKESAQAAFSYVRSRAPTLGVDEEFYRTVDVHIHVPAAAVPKDGPSGGITMATAIASALSRRAVRKDVAMTGEISLRGRVLAVGGIKEKALAAHRAGIRDIVLPRENERDLDELPAAVRDELRFHPVSHMDEVLAIALSPLPVVETGTEILRAG